jgi:hypothetical protein
MQVRLYLPFVDSRYLDPGLSQYIVEPRDQLSPEKLFMRCGGGLTPNELFHCKNLISISSTTIPKMKIAERTLEYPFGNKLIGVYLFAIDFEESNQVKIPANEIIGYLNNNLDIYLRTLLEKPQLQHKQNPNAPRNSKVKTNIYQLKDEMKIQYYLSTLRLKEKGPYSKNAKAIIDPNPEVSIENIQFLTPIVSIDKEPKHNPLIDGTHYEYIGGNVRVGKRLNNGVILYHIRREWRYSIFPKKKRIEAKKINESIDNIVKSEYSISACDTLLSKINSKYNSDMAEAVIDNAFGYCNNNGNSFPIFNKGLDKGKRLSLLLSSVKKAEHLEAPAIAKIENSLKILGSLEITGITYS